MLMDKKVERVILSRPAVEAGERLGFLPGDMKEKLDPYLRPLYDALYDLFGFEKIQKKIETGEIEIAPLAFMRGRTLKNSLLHFLFPLSDIFPFQFCSGAEKKIAD